MNSIPVTNLNDRIQAAEKVRWAEVVCWLDANWWALLFIDIFDETIETLLIRQWVYNPLRDQKMTQQIEPEWTPNWSDTYSRLYLMITTYQEQLINWEIE